MATIKAYTDPSQSKTLSKILPLESADGGWYETDNPLAANTEYWLYTKYTEKAALPAWSLVALLGVLPPHLYEWEKGIDFNLYPSVAKKRWWCAGYISQYLSPENKDKFILITHADNPVDACYEMILTLHELNLL